MKYLTNLLLISIFMANCENRQATISKKVEEVFNCSKGEMRHAWYEYGINEAIPNIEGLKNEFVIIVDTSYRAVNFISMQEQFLRQEAEFVNMNSLEDTKGWKKLSMKQKRRKLAEKKNRYLYEADTLHVYNNKGQQQIWIINNSSDTILLQVQDGSFICVLQALTKNKQWLPIQYWRFSKCGNSYYTLNILPKTASSFITNRTKKGNFKTKLRYKFLGGKNFYYSNEFDGQINYCEFIEDSTSYDWMRTGIPKPHFKLDSMINTIWEPDLAEIK